MATDNLEQILSDPGYQALDDTERMGIRRAFYRNKATDPGFRSLPDTDKTAITRDILFPESEQKAEPVNVARPKPSIGETFKEGWKLATTPSPVLGPNLLGVAQMAGSPLQPAANWVATQGEKISDYLNEKGHPTLGTVAGALTTGVGDYATGFGAGKALGLLKTPLAKALPTIKEKVGLLNADKAARLAANETAATDAQLAVAKRAQNLPAETNQRLSDIDKAAADAQVIAEQAQTARLQQIPIARAGIQQQAATETQAAQNQLATQQQRVGQEAAQAIAPAAPKRANFTKRYDQALSMADQYPTQPTNLNTAAMGLRREAGVSALPTQAERSATGTASMLTEGALPQIEEEIGSKVRRMITQGTNAKDVDYKAVTAEVLGTATADNVSVGTLLRTEKRLRAAQRAAYGADHKNLGRQFGNMEDAVAKDIEAAAKSNPQVKKAVRISRMADKDWQKKVNSEWFAEGVDQAIDPATGVWDRKRFTKWFEKHSDVTNNDRDLRRFLGDNYDSAKGLVGEMQNATATNIEGAAKEAARNAKRRMGEQLREVGRQETQIGAEGKKIAGQISDTREATAKKTGEEFAAQRKDLLRSEKDIETSRTTNAKAIEDEISQKSEAIIGKPYSDKVATWMGSIAVIGGVEQTIMGNPSVGMAGIAGGLVTLMTHGAVTKLLNTARGASLLKRAVRAVPGTGEAIATSSAIARVLAQANQDQAKNPETPQDFEAQAQGVKRDLKKAGEDVLSRYGVTAPAAPEIRQPKLTSADVETKKANLLKKYGLPSQ